MQRVQNSMMRNTKIASCCTFTTFSHLNEGQNQPVMVNVNEKQKTKRVATATSFVQLPLQVYDALEIHKWNGPKGPIFATAIVAGVLAAKATSSLIPFCHPIALEGCEVDIVPTAADELVGLQITCTVTVVNKTGVEMEALTGASVAALTVYDMCKGMAKNDIVIKSTRLISKSGGKSSDILV